VEADQLIELPADPGPGGPARWRPRGGCSAGRSIRTSKVSVDDDPRALGFAGGGAAILFDGKLVPFRLPSRRWTRSRITR